MIKKIVEYVYQKTYTFNDVSTIIEKYIELSILSKNTDVISGGSECSIAYDDINLKFYSSGTYEVSKTVTVIESKNWMPHTA